ncbi:MAG: alpha/beta fold hydrolase [Betaproteobacteria bacterium]|nr:alpha/beta fold hydrolase [Betaproteobacteria bacterium]NBO44439.1 alpha/beta fold hydrolase [Betaproteobacteria bacterium]NBP10936.1 alpha/beta fold hydrolase [Betaproteobacteria bacterium]NBP61724.1 alpha/beta fold hydrolase [Betaproteobacteria bacterium]NBQ09903.1 alpha/beta fold hydrolase [Betaproteobacteria bacterium]
MSRGWIPVLGWVMIALLLRCVDASAQSEAFQPVPENRLIQFSASDGTRIPIRFWGNLHEPTQIILGVHGFSDYARGFSHLIQALDPEGRRLLVAFDQRGFGEQASRGQWSGVERMVDDLTEILVYLSSQYPNRPLHVIGESMGAALILVAMHQTQSASFFALDSLAREKRTARVQSSVLLAPAVWGWSSMPWYQRYGLKLLHQLAADMTLSSRHARDLGVRPTDDGAVASYLARDPLMLRDIRVSMLAGLTDLMDNASALMPAAGHRSLIVLGTRDEVIPKVAYCHWLGQSKAPASSRWFIQDEGFHMLTRQTRRKEIIQLLQTFWDHPQKLTTPSEAPQQALKCT